MTPFEAVRAWFSSHWVSDAEIRAETWALGGRHAGRVLEGAHLELKVPGISVRRAILLGGVIRNRSRAAPALDHPT